ncbi:hypothetical protein COV16_02295 [Candidatus Woesearchaeota archaeon CG10_big_fil_rev_8_21_14_0_10_34_8]|nr:MAG: hypothetical protein COV16_02295 [Candidatus Woesearchaeota archaeon CG10_big_fil_rev_8_21_14_0_10_34_8]
MNEDVEITAIDSNLNSGMTLMELGFLVGKGPREVKDYLKKTERLDSWSAAWAREYKRLVDLKVRRFYRFSDARVTGLVEKLEDHPYSEITKYDKLDFSVKGYSYDEVLHALCRLHRLGMHYDMRPYHLKGTSHVWKRPNGIRRDEMVNSALQELVGILLLPEDHGGYGSREGIIVNITAADFGKPVIHPKTKAVLHEGRRVHYGRSLEVILPLFDNSPANAIIHAFQNDPDDIVACFYQSLRPYHFHNVRRWTDDLTIAALDEVMEIVFAEQPHDVVAALAGISAKHFGCTRYGGDPKMIRYGANLKSMFERKFRRSMPQVLDFWLNNTTMYQAEVYKRAKKNHLN